MSFSAKIAIAAIIVWIGSIVVANVIGTPDYGLPEEKQRQIKFIMITVQFVSLYSIPVALVAGLFAYMGHRNRKLEQQYARERADRAAAAELANEEGATLPGPVDPQLQALKQILTDIHASSSSPQTKQEAETIVASIERRWNDAERNGEEFKHQLKALIAIADNALKEPRCSALQTIKAML